METCKEQLTLKTMWPENLSATVLPVLRFHQIPPVPYNKTSSSGFLFPTTKSSKSRERKRWRREEEGCGRERGVMEGWGGESMNESRRHAGLRCLEVAQSVAKTHTRETHKARREEGVAGRTEEKVGAKQKCDGGTRAREMEEEVGQRRRWRRKSVWSRQGHCDPQPCAVPVGGCCSRHSAASPHPHPWSPGRRYSWAGDDRGWGTAVGAMIPLALGTRSAESG